MNFDHFVRSLSGMYVAQDNDTRRALTLDVLQQEDRMNREELLRFGVQLLRATEYGAAAQAYGAVLLRRAISSGRLDANAVPYEDIMNWYMTEPSMGRLLAGDLVELLTECMVHEWPENYPDLLPQICPPQAQLALQPRKLELLQSLILTFTEPHGRVPVERMRNLKRAVTQNGRLILVEVTQALFDLYTAATCGNTNTFTSKGIEMVAAALGILTALAPTLPVAMWWEVGIGSTLAALVRWPPAAPEALASAAALLRCDALPAAAAVTGVEPELSALVNAATTGASACVAERSYAALEETVDLLLDLPESILRAEAAAVVQACMAILEVPSIFIASGVCAVLWRLGEMAFAHLSAQDLMMRLAALVPKNRLHPTRGTNAEGRELSELQYGSEELFERGFSEFRGIAGRLLTAAAQAYPVLSNQFILKLLSELCSGQGTSSDPRTPSGSVTHQSATYIEWEATQFLVEHLSNSFKASSEYVPQAIAALMAQQKSDVVLLPVFFNMLSSFWCCRDDTILGVWDRSFDILFTCMERRDYDQNDPDAVSARKRAFTLLVTACSDFAQQVAPLYCPIMRRMEHMLVMPSTQPHEKPLVYEAVAALTAALPPDEAMQQLRCYLEPIIGILVKSAVNMNQSRFNILIVGKASEHVEDRSTLRNALNIIASILRRSPRSPYLIETATSLAPCIVHLMELAHGIRAEDLPLASRTILERDKSEREQFLPGRQRRSDINMNAFRQARHVLMNVRMSLYQIIGSFSAFLPDQTLASMLQALIVAVDGLSIDTLRQLATHCLFRVGSEHAALIPIVMQACGRFFACHSRIATGGVVQAKRLEDEVIDSKQLFNLSRDLFEFIRRRIVETRQLDGNAPLAQLCVEVALSVLDSGANTAESSRFIMNTIERKEVREFIPDFGVFVFGRMMEFTVRIDDAFLPSRIRERLATVLADAYMNRFPAYTNAVRERFPPALVDELHAHLTVSQRGDLKRRHFKEFLLGVGKK